MVLMLTLASCSPPVAAGIAVGSFPVAHRSPVDALVSLASGRDCSMVHLDAGTSYCKPLEQPPDPPPYCTRSLGVADCWIESSLPSPPPREIADGPRALTPLQEEQRVRRWPGLW